MSNAITLGPLTFGTTPTAAADANGVYWFAEKLGGWGSPKTTLTVTQKPRAHGGWRSEAFLTSRVIVVDGTIQAPTAAKLALARHALNAAASLSDTTLSVTEYGETLSCTVTRQDEVLYGDETETWTTFSVQLVAEDPLRYGATVTASTHMPSTTGGLTLPVTLATTIAATTITGFVGLNNPGNISSPLILRVDGPCVGPIITHVSSGIQLILSSTYSLASGNWLIIDTANQSVKENGQASRSGYLLSAGWPSFDPGDNTFGFNGSVYNSSALLTISAAPAYQ